MQEISCPLCGKRNYKVLYTSTLTNEDFNLEVLRNHLKNTLDDYTKHGQIVRCDTCSLVYTNPMEDLSTILKGYEEVVDEEYLQTEHYRKLLLKNHLKKLRVSKKKGTLLDVGCFAGFFLEIAKEQGWKIYGIEPSQWAGKIAKKKGVTMLGHEIEKAKLKNNFFDAITLFDVIEHLGNPHKVMTVLEKTMKKNGILLMATPNIDSLFAKILGKRYPFLIRMHLILYSPKTLKMLFEQHGFKVINTGNYIRIFPLYYILGKIQWKNKPFTWIKSALLSYPRIANFSVHLNFGDTFYMIGKKL